MYSNTYTHNKVWQKYFNCSNNCSVRRWDLVQLVNLCGVGEVIKDNDLLLCILNGIEHKYDPVTVLIAIRKQTMSLREAQYMLMVHEQEIEHLNSGIQIDVPNSSANFASNQPSNKQSRRADFANGRNNNKARGRGRVGMVEGGTTITGRHVKYVEKVVIGHLTIIIVSTGLTKVLYEATICRNRFFVLLVT
ncbi:hypothetical protein ACOSQ3_013411 [Xanthoceras sorbifolium]